MVSWESFTFVVSKVQYKKKIFDLEILTATLWFWTRGYNVYISNNINS